MSEQSQTKPDDSQKATEKTSEKETPEEGTPEEENLEEEIEKSPEEASETGGLGALFSPEGIIMMLLAGLIDTIGLFCLALTLVFGIGQAISPILDTIGLILIGGWMLSRYGRMTGTKGAKKAGGKLLKRFGLSFLGELIPIFGDVAPCWTLAVYFTLKSSR